MKYGASWWPNHTHRTLGGLVLLLSQNVSCSLFSSHLQRQEAQWAEGLEGITELGKLATNATWVLGSRSYTAAGASSLQAAMEFLGFLLSVSSPPSILSKVSCLDWTVF